MFTTREWSRVGQDHQPVVQSFRPEWDCEKVVVHECLAMFDHRLIRSVRAQVSTVVHVECMHYRGMENSALASAAVCCANMDSILDQFKVELYSFQKSI